VEESSVRAGGESILLIGMAQRNPPEALGRVEVRVTNGEAREASPSTVERGCTPGWTVSSAVLRVPRGLAVDDLAFYKEGQLCAMINSSTDTDSGLLSDQRAGSPPGIPSPTSLLVMVPGDALHLNSIQVVLPVLHSG
jgi:hypothetical protein